MVGRTPDAQSLLRAIVEDLATVRAAYERAGLLGASPGRMALGLLGGGESAERFRRDFLIFDAVVRVRVAWLALDGGRLRHLVAFGGNNVGKSTVVNVLAASSIAGVGPEGGHTRHAQAFFRHEAPLAGENPYALRGFVRVPPVALDDDRVETYAVTPIVSAALPIDAVLWDTPDCDSAAATQYLASVIETIALADLVVYVTTVEKYAVADLVEWLFVLHAAGVPLLQCLNKTLPKDRDAIIRRQRETIIPMMARRLAMAAPDPPVVALGYLSEGTESDLWGPHHPEAAVLREQALSALDASDRRSAGLAALAFVRRRLEAMLEPAVLEMAARATWEKAVERALMDFVNSYERRYLTSEKVIEPFTRLNLELLQLLDPDMPRLKQAIQILRRLVRWQNTLAIAAARQMARVFRDATAPDGGGVPAAPPEFAAYGEAHIELLNTLARCIDAERARARHHPFWDIANEEWQAQIGPLSADFAARIGQHMDETDRAIKAAAQDIFNELRRQPALLVTLRGARIVADVGGIALTLAVPHVGGFVYDLLEEAVLAQVTTGITEAATGAAVRGFVTNRRRRLRDSLLRDAQEIADSVYGAKLRAIAEIAATRAGAIGASADVIGRLRTSLGEFARTVGQTA